MFAGKKPTNLGMQNNRLAPCPNMPNCVCSYDTDPVHQIEPLPYRSTAAEALVDLKAILQQLPKTTIVSETSNYLYTEFKSALMGFVDDVEFYVDEVAQVVQIRSASRLGKSDLGVNRKRIEMIRAEFNATQSQK